MLGRLLSLPPPEVAGSVGLMTFINEVTDDFARASLRVARLRFSRRAHRMVGSALSG
jgi:hypothetical protein